MTTIVLNYSRNLFDVFKPPFKIIGDFLGPKPLASMFGEAITLGDAPLQGEHTIEILSELGYAENVQKDLLEKSVIKKSGT